MATKEPLTSKKYVDGIYIPAGLIVLGTAIVKREWLPYAVVLAIALGAIKFLRTRKSDETFHQRQWVTWKLYRCIREAQAHHTITEPKKALKPDVFQEFELKEKTILSHNTAM